MLRIQKNIIMLKTKDYEFLKALIKKLLLVMYEIFVKLNATVFYLSPQNEWGNDLQEDVLKI